MRGRALVVLLLAAACAAAACGRSGGDGGARADRPPASPAGYPREIVDGAGRALRLAGPPRRIVSQTLGSDEVLIDLVAPERLVGVSALARDPAYSNVVDRVGSAAPPSVVNAEDVLRLRPDLVFVASFSRAEVVQLLEASGAPVYRLTSFDRLQDVVDNVRRLGRAVGEEAAAERLVARLEARVAAVARRRAGRPAPRVLSYSPGGFTAGAGTLFDDLVQRAGGVNEAARRGLRAFPRISAEQVLAWQPDLIVAGHMPGQAPVVRRELLANPAIAATRAARDGRILLLENRVLLAVSPYVVSALERLADAFDAVPQPGAGAGGVGP
jgi:iron complex transport system substrate-binding protein